MKQDSLGLEARIEAFELDEHDAVDTFSRRLARENGWSEPYTRRVVQEYKRFLTLAVTTDHVVTPSEQIDQAWHLHVLHAARYRRFCNEVLGRRLDHSPSDGSSEERLNFVRAYEQTLSSYERRFGERPPIDIWPDAQRRFGVDLAVRRVNTHQHWVLKKPRAWLWLAAWLRRPRREHGTVALVTCVLAALACGCSASLSSEARAPEYLRGFLLLWLITTAVAYLLKKLQPAAPSSPLPTLEPYELAQLAGGPGMALDSAITSLLARGVLELDSERGVLIAKRPAPNTAPRLEHDVYEEVARSGELLVGRLRRQASRLTQTLAGHLIEQGLISVHPARLPLVVGLAAPVAGVFGILGRLGSHEPVALLIVLTVVATVVALGLFFSRRGRTQRGEAVLAAAREAHEALRDRENAATLAENGSLPIVFALFGTSAIAGLASWNISLKQFSSEYVSGCGDVGGGCRSDGDGDGGGGCDGGGCGGGCGGD
jgi:uncharacterized protein (TIGR04222 family)